MLDGLCGSDERGIENGLVLDFNGDFVGLLDDTVAGHCVPLGSLPSFWKRLLKPLDLLIGLFEMAFQRGDEVAVRSPCRSLGQRFEDLLLGVIDVLQTSISRSSIDCMSLVKIPISTSPSAMMAMERR